MRYFDGECPYCHEKVIGYACATCGWIPFDPDSTGNTGEEDHADEEE